MSFLARIRAQSGGVKTHYAFIGAGLVTGIIGIVWISTVPARFAEITRDGTDVVEEKETLGIGAVFEETKNKVGNIIDWNTELRDETDTELSPDSALGGLNTKSVPEEILITTTSTPQATVKEEKKEEKSPQPKVILIATTTRQKSE